jgi:hypothetical protein
MPYYWMQNETFSLSVSNELNDFFQVVIVHLPFGQNQTGLPHCD